MLTILMSTIVIIITKKCRFFSDFKENWHFLNNIVRNFSICAEQKIFFLRAVTSGLIVNNYALIGSRRCISGR